MVKTPSSTYMGGKSRLRKWLIEHFPVSGNIYLEPFVGLGNVFFQSRKDLNFKEWKLGDKNNFLTTLLKVNLDDLPDAVTKESFRFWKEANNDVARVIEPRISFAGKGYGAGYNGYHHTHTPYKKENYLIICKEARRLLSGVEIRQCCWTKWEYGKLDWSDFVYFDPPYYNTKSSYSNIDHEKLITTLSNAEYKWALSGYDNSLYNDNLEFKCCFVKERNSEIKGSNRNRRIPVNEFLWTNY